ncbi:MAG: DUF4184 family protein [Calditrichia bacterium]
MPFTFAHPAVIFPFYKRWRIFNSLSALTIGSMAPDMSYFLPFHISRHATHSPGALLWFCLPVGLAVYIVFHVFLKRPIWFLLPSSLRIPLQDVALRNRTWHLKEILHISIAILVGAITHIGWDLFTHRSIVTGTYLPLLNEPVFSMFGRPFRVHNILQHVSTVFGFFVIGFVAKQYLSSRISTGNEPLKWANSLRRRLRQGLLFVSGGTGVFFGLGALAHPSAFRSFTYFVRYFVISGINAAIVCLLLMGITWLLLQRFAGNDKWHTS